MTHIASLVCASIAAFALLVGCSRSAPDADVDATFDAELATLQRASLKAVYYRSNPLPPVPDDEEKAQAKARLEAADALERELLTELYPADPEAWALATRDTDGDGLFDFRVSDYYGRFMEGDTDLDDDGIDNVLDANPFAADDAAPSAGLPAHLDWGRQDKPADMVRIQRELYAQHRILLVERSAEFTPALALSVYDTITRVYREIFADGGTLPTLRVIATEEGSLLLTESEESTDDFAQVLPATQTMEIYRPGIDASPVIQLGFLAHEIGHNIQFGMDYDKQRQDEIMRRNYFAASHFHELIEEYGWSLVYYDEDPDAEFELFRPQYVSQEPYEYFYLDDNLDDWEAWLNAIYDEVGDEAYLTDERITDLHILGDYSMSGPWEWYSDHIIAYVYLAMIDSLAGNCTEAEREALADTFGRTTVQAEWPYFRFQNARGAEIQAYLASTYPLADEDVKYLATNYLLTTQPDACQTP